MGRGAGIVFQLAVKGLLLRTETDESLASIVVEQWPFRERKIVGLRHTKIMKINSIFAPASIKILVAGMGF